MFIAIEEYCSDVTLGDHVFGRCCKIFEMIGRSMRLKRSGVVINLEEEHMIWIILRDCNVELAATRIFC